MVYARPKICPRKWDAHISLRFWDTNGSLDLGQTIRSYNNQQQQQKNENLQIVEFAVLADHRVKFKECEKKNKFLELSRELKKLSTMKVMIIPFVIGALSTDTKGLVPGPEDLEKQDEKRLPILLHY